MSGLPGSPSRRRRSGSADGPFPGPDPDPGLGRPRRDSFTFSAFAETRDGPAAQAPTPEPLLPEPFNRYHVHEPYTAYGVRTSTASAFAGGGPAPAVLEVAADPEGRFVWTTAGGSGNRLYRAGGNPAARPIGGDGATARGGGGGGAGAAAPRFI